MYASKEDIDNLYGVELLVRLADNNRDGIPDPEIVDRGLVAADEICDAYLSAVYTVPLTSTPGVIRNCAIDIAVYKIALSRGTRTDEMRLRYEDALAILDKISAGKIGLGLPTTTGDDGTVTDPNAKRYGRSIDCWRA